MQWLLNPTTLLVAATLLLVLWGFVTLYFGRLLMPAPDPYKAGAGANYAAAPANAGQRMSLVLLVAGWILVVIGALLAMTAAVVGPGTAKEGAGDTIINAILLQRGLLSTACAIICAGIGWQFLDRSSAASQAASVATLAIASIASDDESDREAYAACVKAKASWLEGRMNHDRVLSIVSDLRSTTNAKDPNPPPRPDTEPKLPSNGNITKP